MPRFVASYVARSGRLRRTKLDSINQARLAEEIETTHKAYVIEIVRIRESRQVRGRIRISGRMLLAALDSLELMLASGVRINSAVRTLAECAPPGAARRLWTELATLIEEFGSFGDASRHFPRVFNDSMVGIIAAHEAAGCLSEGIAIVRSYVAQMQEIRRESLRGTAYPLIVGLAGAAASAILCVFTLPRFSKMLADIGVKKTNRVTEFFFRLSDVVVRHPIYVILAFVIPIISILTCSRSRFRSILDSMMLRLPVLRSAVEALAMARICVTFKALTGFWNQGCRGT